MIRFVLRRLAAAVPLVLGVLTLTFAAMELAPGTPVDRFLGDRPVPPEVRSRLESAYGLDRPAPERYVRWLGSVARGELGWSLSRSQPVARALAGAVPATLALAGAALAIHLVAGVLLGVVSAVYRDRWPDRLIGVGGVALWAMPTFWLALMAVLVLSHGLGAFPPSSMRSVAARDWGVLARLADLAWHVALPACVLGLTSAAATARFVRAAMVRSLDEDFVRAARARGVGGRRLFVVHALRGAMLPVINLLGLALPVLVSGSLVVEVVFAWPGMGRMTYEAILAQDFPVVLAATLLASVLVVLGSLGADLAMAAADPRIRFGGAGGTAR